jgi:DNA-binding response OmpR family regulator
MSERVLVADDEPFILRSLSFVLERAGFEVHQARNGDEALEVLRDVRPRVCVLDVMMPRRNGYDVCETVKGDPDLRDTYVMLLTAKGQDSARARGLKAGADEFMTKPFSPSRIVERIREVLGQADGEAGEPLHETDAAAAGRGHGTV